MVARRPQVIDMTRAARFLADHAAKAAPAYPAPYNPYLRNGSETHVFSMALLDAGLNWPARMNKAPCLGELGTFLHAHGFVLLALNAQLMDGDVAVFGVSPGRDKFNAHPLGTAAIRLGGAWIYAARNVRPSRNVAFSMWRYALHANG